MGLEVELDYSRLYSQLSIVVSHHMLLQTKKSKYFGLLAVTDFRSNYLINGEDLCNFFFLFFLTTACRWGKNCQIVVHKLR